MDCQVATARGLFHIVEATHDGGSNDGPKYKRCSTFKAHHIRTEPFSPRGLPPLPWASVGVSRFKTVDRSSVVMLHRDEIVGKVMNCNGVLTEWRKSWLMSKKEQ